MAKYPRRPTDQEKKHIVSTVFEDKPVADVDFRDVWMLTDFYGEDLDFNCFAWSILAITTITIPDKLDTLVHLAGQAKEKYGAPYNYSLTDLSAKDAVIVAWGDSPNDIMHASRICTKTLLLDHAKEFRLKFDFSSAAAAGFPDEIWSSKFGDKYALITHPKEWLSGGVWGTAQGALKIKT